MSSTDAPFPWFGGKSRVAPLVWERFGLVTNYVEPFAGSLACLLGRPQPWTGVETVNDLDGYLANFWRAIKHRPDETAEYADTPCNENDLHARHVWLVQRKEHLRAELEGDPEWCDPKIAGWWCWGLANWIGGGWCNGENGPWWVDEHGRLVKRERVDAGQGVKRQLLHLGSAGQGVKRQRPVVAWFVALSARLARVRVASGDWARVTGPSVTRAAGGVCAVFLDPPYADTAGRHADLYATDSLTVAHDVRDWAVANGDDPSLRIALCGYEGEHVMPGNWECVEWKAHGGYGLQGDGAGRENATHERIWFSPACLSGRQGTLFGESRPALLGTAL